MELKNPIVTDRQIFLDTVHAQSTVLNIRFMSEMKDMLNKFIEQRMEQAEATLVPPETEQVKTQDANIKSERIYDYDAMPETGVRYEKN
jgi:hypothetical protein